MFYLSSHSVFESHWESQWDSASAHGTVSCMLALQTAWDQIFIREPSLLALLRERFMLILSWLYHILCIFLKLSI